MSNLSFGVGAGKRPGYNKKSNSLSDLANLRLQKQQQAARAGEMGFLPGGHSGHAYTPFGPVVV